MLVVSKDKGFDMSGDLRLPLGMAVSATSFKPIGAPNSQADVSVFKQQLEKIMDSSFEAPASGDVMGIWRGGLHPWTLKKSKPFSLVCSSNGLSFD